MASTESNRADKLPFGYESILALVPHEFTFVRGLLLVAGGLILVLYRLLLLGWQTAYSGDKLIVNSHTQEFRRRCTLLQARPTNTRVCALMTPQCDIPGQLLVINVVSPRPICSRMWTRPGGIADQLMQQYGVDLEPAVKRFTQERQMPHGNRQPIDVAHAVVFLASPLARMITGASIDICGAIRGILHKFAP